MKTISFEFFPRKSVDGKVKLRKNRDELVKYNPKHFSLTFNTCRRTKKGTYKTIIWSGKNIGINTMPRLSCIGITKKNIRQKSTSNREKNIRRFIAFSGNMPPGMQEAGEFDHTIGLVELFRSETGDYYNIEVPAYPEFHPQSISHKTDLEYFKKIDARVNGLIIQ